MKALKILMALFVIALFSMGNSVEKGIDNERAVYVITEPWEGIDWCSPEPETILGTATITTIVLNNKIQCRTVRTGIGQTSGALYEGKEIFNENYNITPSGTLNYTLPLTGQMFKDGVPNRLVHVTYHITILPDGITVTADHYNLVIKCL